MNDIGAVRFGSRNAPKCYMLHNEDRPVRRDSGDFNSVPWHSKTLLLLALPVVIYLLLCRFVFFHLRQDDIIEDEEQRAPFYFFGAGLFCVFIILPTAILLTPWLSVWLTCIIIDDIW